MVVIHPGDVSSPPQALTEAIPIAREHGFIQLTMNVTERVSGIAIVSKIPVTLGRVMFAPAILATVHEPADYGPGGMFLIRPGNLVRSIAILPGGRLMGL